MLCLILNYLGKGKKFPSEKEASPWSYTKLFHSYRLFWLKVLSETWNFLLRKKLWTLMRCLVFLSWKSKRVAAWEACRDGAGCTSAPEPQPYLSHSDHFWLWCWPKVVESIGEKWLEYFLVLEWHKVRRISFFCTLNVFIGVQWQCPCLQGV